jgi:predicted TPR repeat methyltransferase
MGSSSNEGKQWIYDFIRSLKREVRTILDIGPGQGTYQTLMSPLVPQARWTGVEIFQLYIDYFKLRERYNEVINQDIRTFVPHETYDIIFAGDVLEHMTKEDAIAVVQGLMPFCSYLIISIPIVKWEQPAFNGNPFEEHIKDDWSHSEVMSAFQNIEQHYAGEKIGAYVVRGKVL